MTNNINDTKYSFQVSSTQSLLKNLQTVPQIQINIHKTKSLPFKINTLITKIKKVVSPASTYYLPPPPVIIIISEKYR